MHYDKPTPMPAIKPQVTATLVDEVTKVVSPASISLTLDLQSAAVLRCLLRKVGGDIDGPRAAVNRILGALKFASIPYDKLVNGHDDILRDASMWRNLFLRNKRFGETW